MAELLSPAGNFEKMKMAFLYGADAVYLAGTNFGMRAAADNFTLEEMNEAIGYAHARGKKIYITLNTMPREHEYPALKEFLKALAGLENGAPDAAIVADIGVMNLVKELLPKTELHISTQSGIVSSADAIAWHKYGATRVVLARELSMAEIKEIRKNIPKELEIEAFIHGSMCVSFSGRCLLSNALVGRDANRGACAQPCRWNYTIREEKRPDMPFPIEEYKEGTYIMSSKDMCMLEHVPELMESGIDSFKIEGRMKSAYYTAICANTYKMAMNEYLKNPSEYKYNPLWLRELESVSHREYATGFYFDNPMENPQTVTQNGYLREKAYLCVATGEYDGEFAWFTQRNKIVEGDFCEIITPSECGKAFVATELYNEKGEKIESAPHPSMKFKMRVPFPVKAGDIVRSSDK